MLSQIYIDSITILNQAEGSVVHEPTPPSILIKLKQGFTSQSGQ